MNFKKSYLVQTELGKLFGVSSHVIGGWLAELGLRSDQSPTDKAIIGSYCILLTKQNFTNYAWDATKVVPEFIEAGYEPLIELPINLVHPPEMVGPFKVSSKNPARILNASGDCVLLIACRGVGQILCAILNIAHKLNKFGLR